jgi:hypothetical protein
LIRFGLADAGSAYRIMCDRHWVIAEGWVVYGCVAKPAICLQENLNVSLIGTPHGGIVEACRLTPVEVDK